MILSSERTEKFHVYLIVLINESVRKPFLTSFFYTVSFFQFHPLCTAGIYYSLRVASVYCTKSVHFRVL